ncbi:MAG TPA: SDR family NAD(P)-dependent oxidoreductase [Ornithinibacter sp.]|nr:SDR family NAD(P)-dependent oxidoreductase [Ornithinibacter sp.]
MQEGTVVVTGSSSGIGLAVCELLVGRGYRVVAGVRSEADADRLRALDDAHIEPHLLDITSDDDLRSLARHLNDGRRVTALVNNAGIAVPGPVELLPTEEWRRQFEVNVFGTVAVTRAVLPRLLESRGRIVNVSSISGFVAPPVLAAYSASKHALEAISDALRRELVSTGVRVVVVEPGDVVTPIWTKGRTDGDRRFEAAPADVQARYADLIAAVRARSETALRTGMPAGKVAEVVLQALVAERPRTRYQVGREAKVLARVRRVLPDRVLDAVVLRALR